MSINKERLNYLLQRYVDKASTPEEVRELFGYIGNGEADEELFALMDEKYKAGEVNAEVHNVDWDSVYSNIVGTDTKKSSGSRGWIRYAAAAVILLIAGFGLWFNKPAVPQQQTFAVKNDIAPGSNKAILTLANGKKITLDSTHKGNIGKQGSTAIAKTDEGEVVYDATKNVNLYTAEQKEVPVNTLSTPKAGQYHVVLPDGSKVWLNAASSLTFPVAFNGKDRKVKLSGEAYFEVAKDKTKPFFVQMDDAEVQVLGTHFDAMSYPDDKIRRTTLLEGSVKIGHLSQNQVLKPGEQAVYQDGVDKLHVQEVDTDDVIAWKNGLFVFEGNTIEEVMKKIERWYNVDIEYAGEKPTIKFTGVMPRNNNVSKVLHILELTGGVKFGVEGNTITIKAIHKH